MTIIIFIVVCIGIFYLIQNFIPEPWRKWALIIVAVILIIFLLDYIGAGDYVRSRRV